MSDGKKRTTFFPITVFGEYGEPVAESLTKGRQVLVEGRVEVSDNSHFNAIADRIVLGAMPEKSTRKAK